MDWMEFQVERQLDGHWYSMGAVVEAESAKQSVAICAVSEGTYRTRPARTPRAVPDYFEVPPWGRPIQLRPR